MVRYLHPKREYLRGNDCALAESSGSCIGSAEAPEAEPKRNTINILLLGHNTSPHADSPLEKQFSMAQYKALLQDEGQVDSPLLARLGYPIILVSTTKGRKFIPVVCSRQE